MIERMTARYTDRLPLMPGAVEAVPALAARWPLGLARPSAPALIGTALDAASLQAAFAVTMSAEQVARGKPAPDIYLVVADRLGHRLRLVLAGPAELTPGAADDQKAEQALHDHAEYSQRDRRK